MLMSQPESDHAAAVPTDRSARYAAIGFGIALLIGTGVSGMYLAHQNGEQAVLLELQSHHAAAIAHLVMIDALAPVFFVFSVAPTNRGITSVDATFTAGLATASACLISLLRLGVGTWLASSDSVQPIAAYAGVRAMTDLDGARTALVSIVLITFVRHRDKPTVREPLDILLITTSIAVMITAVADVTGYTAIGRSTWLSVPLLLIAVCAVARAATPRSPRVRSTPVP